MNNTVRRKRNHSKPILIMCGAILFTQIILMCFVCTLYTQYEELKDVEPIIQYRTVYVKEIAHNTETLTAPTEEGTPAYTEMTVTATAYCPCKKCCNKDDGITATGTQATAGRTIAVDPSIIPYGTEVIINGHTYIAEDCGGAIKGNKIDIYFDTHAEALKFGRQTLTVFVG